eukprot:CAMPEP_0197915060 /NCGR_PEP_ID=MMETSP1439-20131203/79561_1 /TAXON_ID=66791 /ORGANISM="Gonyaulax spinifera, Strain CCMP409" /LENGTH=128 /DNA_ID=CAMNT_0043536997 /DNA_START=6 /DNA_END=392 /DNA_ORIENTATION=+
MRRILARSILALVQPQSPETDAVIVQSLSDLGVKFARGDPKFMAFMPRLLFNRLQAEWVRDGGKLLQEVCKRDWVVEQPVEVLMCCRSVGYLKGLCFTLQENVDFAEVCRPWAERWLLENPEKASPQL